jgi:BlaI family transcriptional regulator, penicillinase repressor
MPDNKPTWMRRSRGRTFASLGFLEADILAIVWERKQATVRDVYETLLERRRIAYTTVMTVMGNLATKGLLVRDQTNTAYLYRPAIPRQEVIAAVTDSLIEGLCGGETATALSHLLGLPARLSADQVEQLKEFAQHLPKP